MAAPFPDYHAMYMALRGDHNTLYAQTTALLTEKDSLTTDNARLTTENTRLSAENGKLSSDNQGLSYRIADLGVLVGGLKLQNTKAGVQIMQLTEDAGRVDNHFDGWKSDLLEDVNAFQLLHQKIYDTVNRLEIGGAGGAGGAAAYPIAAASAAAGGAAAYPIAAASAAAGGAGGAGGAAASAAAAVAGLSGRRRQFYYMGEAGSKRVRTD